MNRIKVHISALVLILSQVFSSVAVDISDISKVLVPSVTDTKIFTSLSEEKKARLQERIQARQKANTQLDQDRVKRKEKVDRLRAQVEDINAEIRKGTASTTLTKTSKLLNELLNTQKEYQQIQNKRLDVMDQEIRLLEDYLKDTNFQAYAQQLIKIKKQYSFEDLHILYQQKLEKEQEIAALTEQDKNASAELENRRRAATSTLEEYTKRRSERESSESTMSPDERILWNLEQELFEDRKLLDELMISETEDKISLIKTKKFIARKQLEAIQELLPTIRSAITVKDTDIATARQDFERKRQASYSQRNNYYQEIEKIEADQKVYNQELEQLSRRYNIPVDAALETWTKNENNTPDSYPSYCEMGAAYDALLFVNRRKELLKAQLALEDEKINNDEFLLQIKETFSHLVNRQLASNDELTTEVKKYETIKARIKASRSAYQEQQRTAQDSLNLQKRANENLEQFRKRFETQTDVTLKKGKREHNRCLGLLTSASESIATQKNDLTHIVDIYGDIVTMLSNTLRQVDFVLAELGSVTIWQRPVNAISWDGALKIVPDIKAFWQDLSSWFVKKDALSLWGRIKSLFAYIWYALFRILFVAIVWIALLVGIRYGIEYIYGHAGTVARSRFSMRTLGYGVQMLTGYIRAYYIPLTVWLTFLLIGFLYPLDRHVYMLFYLVSIPYLIIMAQRAFKWFVRFNRYHDYVLLSRNYGKRVVFMASFLAYSTIIIFFFRRAFMFAEFQRSELPTILLAVNFIILQISLILLLSKEQIIHLIPIKTSFGEWLAGQVSKYYYLILVFIITIIILSNPYVGFGRLVWYIISHVIYTLAVLYFITVIYRWLKGTSSTLFFVTDEEVSKERFGSAKSWYSLFIITLLLICILIGLLSVSKLWGWPEAITRINSFSDIISWLKTPLIIEQKTASLESISLFTLLQILSFVGVGALVAFAFNRFVLGRVFDILLVDAGVQDAISSISRYLIILIAAILGFQAVGLGALMWALVGALILGISWVVKEPLADFLAYFILLVQRPLKIGDYIQVDDEVKGVVRKVTARAVVLRRKNSTTVVVPNTQILSKPFANWNYTSGYIAFDDITICVSYDADPYQVRDIFMSVLQNSPYILRNPKPIVRLENFGEYGFMFMIRGFLSSTYTLDQWDIASDLRFVMVKQLRDHGIKLALPIRFNLLMQAMPGMEPESHARESGQIHHKK
ncbi:mechanosensitive ion channel [Vermiphilus pyriformis]|uniref:Mechanosensitive ion channel inner membrane domain-containing protein n=1 Tax=candidate division TM6 bacterium JCVI TM6SC1 TaxID=1306947 RepID=A0A0D2JDR1_9BACT|nr:hypothetical protein J120_02240 [candidate division TM6 bacterium JCVI TM6SC1]UNE35182.1 MAG: mechanosensitive ion channel [Vermiphilus pyriformis]